MAARRRNRQKRPRGRSGTRPVSAARRQVLRPPFAGGDAPGALGRRKGAALRIGCRIQRRYADRPGLGRFDGLDERPADLFSPPEFDEVVRRVCREDVLAGQNDVAASAGSGRAWSTLCRAAILLAGSCRGGRLVGNCRRGVFLPSPLRHLRLVVVRRPPGAGNRLHPSGRTAVGRPLHLCPLRWIVRGDCLDDRRITGPFPAVAAAAAIRHGRRLPPLC